MKTALFAFILVTCFHVARSQSVFSNSTNIALEKVIEDYPNRFNNIKGGLLSEDARAARYESKVRIPGSMSCIVSQSNASNTKVFSWKAQLFTSSNFSEASRKYAELFNQIKNTIIKINGTKPYILSGQYCAPAENKTYQAVILSMLPAAGDMQRVRVEISLESQDGKWVLQLSIYDDAEEQLAKTN